MDTIYLLEQPAAEHPLVAAFVSADAASNYATTNQLQGTRIVPVPWFDDYGVTGWPTPIQPR